MVKMTARRVFACCSKAVDDLIIVVATWMQLSAFCCEKMAHMEHTSVRPSVVADYFQRPTVAACLVLSVGSFLYMREIAKPAIVLHI
jgi:hypothetical protein